MTGRYLVTGAAGFIASKVAEQLLDAGHEVVGVDDMNAYYDVRLKKWRLAQLHGHRNAQDFTFHQGDIAELAQMKPLFEGEYDAVLNLAARAGVRYSVENPWIYQRTNVEGTLNLLELARQHDVPKFILASTSSLYGHHNQVPFKETANTDRPPSPYAATKKAAEALCSVYSDLYGMHTPTPRYFTVYGPGGRPDMAPYRFIEWIRQGNSIIMNGDGSQSRDFTFVDDVARGTLAMLEANVCGHEIINLGNGRPVVLNDFVRLIEGALGSTASVLHRPAHDTDMLATLADSSKAWRLLGWRPRVSVEDGVATTVAWHRQELSRALGC